MKSESLQWSIPKRRTQFYVTLCGAFSKCCSNDQWTIIGFTSWKNATEEGKGLKAHETSLNHIKQPQCVSRNTPGR